MTSQDFEGITTKKPLKSLLMTKKGAAGRNNQGRITTRHKGGGVRQHYRIISFSLPVNAELTVEHIEYDPNRSARIARVKDQKGVYYYVLATRGMKPGAKFSSSEEASIESGNRLPLANIPTGTQIHAIEMQPGKGAQLVRSAGVSAQLVAKEGDYAQVRLPSGEVRLLPINCTASIGVLGNEQHQNIKIGKAGRKRKMGVRPTVRGVVMAAVDHPHGGGDGGRHGTAKDPRTPWGQKTLGYKTRHRRKSSKFIVRTRHEAKKR
jgi:large subunit ribosomal protein L2